MAYFDLEQAVTKQEEKKENLFTRDISLFGNRLSNKVKEAFYSELYTLLQAGLDIQSALDIIIQETKKEKIAKVYKQLRTSLIDGETFSNSLKLANKFSEFEFYTIQIGEESGRILEVLESLAEYYQQRIRQQRQIISALTYPILVLVTALGAIFFMLKFIVPMFAEVYKRFDAELPSLTKGVLYLSQHLGTFMLILLLVALSIFILSRMTSVKQWYNENLSLLVLRIPIIGKLISRIQLARFTNALHLLLDSKVSLMEALGLCNKMISYYPIKNSLKTIQKDILQGEAFHASMAKHKVYNKKMVSMMKVGEETNKLDIMLEKIANQYAEEVEHTNARLSSILEPLFILFVGVLVGVILVAMYLPIFQLGISVK